MSKAKAFLTKMVEVLNNENTTLLSDIDLFYLTNSLLPKEERISMSYFEFLKSPNQNNKRSISQNQKLSDDEKELFISALRVGRIKQKMELTKRAFDDKQRNAYPYLWALERKNTELQLQKNTEPQTQNIIQISASNDNHKKLIDNILNAEVIEITPEKIENKGDRENDEPLNEQL